jgi:N utilization substance protein A
MKKKEVKVVNKGIDTTEMMLAMDELEKSNGIKKDELMESIETALVVAYKRNFDSVDDNVKVILDKVDGKMHVYQEKDIVEEVEDPDKEMTLDEAHEINKNYNMGDKVEIELMPKEFGRIAAQTAKQVITQKIREMSRDIIFAEFANKKGEIVTGLIQKADGGAVILDLGKIEGIMPRKEQIQTERYAVNDKIKACVISVEKGIKGSTQIILSRASTEFIRKLFEIEIPEIYEGLIEIKSISREAGSRSKIAVYSQNPNIDPVGSCVGQKGIRIQNIINELNGEKIDVIEWNEDPSIFISTALLPAKVLAVDVRDEERFAQVIVPDDQLSLAIGKAGQNAKLAARLTGWKIDIKSEAQFRQMLEESQNTENEDNTENSEEAELQDENMENDEVLNETEYSEEINNKIEKSDEIEVLAEEKATKKVAKTAAKKSTKKTTEKSEETDESKAKKSAKKSEEFDETKTKKVTKTVAKKSTKKVNEKSEKVEDKKVEKEAKATAKKATKTTKKEEKDSTTKKTTKKIAK